MWLQEGGGRGPCGDGAVLHLTMTQKGMKDICSKCLRQLLLVSKILGDVRQSSRPQPQHVAGAETHLWAGAAVGQLRPTTRDGEGGGPGFPIAKGGEKHFHLL